MITTQTCVHDAIPQFTVHHFPDQPKLCLNPYESGMRAQSAYRWRPTSASDISGGFYLMLDNSNACGSSFCLDYTILFVGHTD